MSISSLCRIALIATLTVASSVAYASPVSTFTTGNSYSGNQNNFTDGLISFTYGGTSYVGAAGNIAGSIGNVNGIAATFGQTFCVDLWDDIYLGTTYNATYSTSGVVKGAAVNNAGEISWLLNNRAPLTSNTAANEGLQAAIWSVEYTQFVLSANNSQAVKDAYNADLLALGSKTAALNSVEWVTPTNSDGSYAQAQVMLVSSGSPTGLSPLTPTPEPSSLALLGTGILGVAGLMRRRYSLHA